MSESATYAAKRIALCTLRLLMRLVYDPAEWRWFRRALGRHWAQCSNGKRIEWFWCVNARVGREVLRQVMGFVILKTETYPATSK